VIRDYLVERNLPLVHWIIRRYSSPSTDHDARLSDGSLALVHAVGRFNPWLGYRFSTYASNAVIRAIMKLGKRESRYRGLFPVQHDVAFERPVEPDPLYPQLCIESLVRALDSNPAELTGLESRVIADRYGLDRGRALTLQEIGAAVGLSKERIRQIQSTALHKLRAALSEDPTLQ
jgi:RNA polymerase sigma factor (sigma-70 family)